MDKAIFSTIHLTAVISTFAEISQFFSPCTEMGHNPAGSGEGLHITAHRVSPVVMEECLKIARGSRRADALTLLIRRLSMKALSLSVLLVACFFFIGFSFV